MRAILPEGFPAQEAASIFDGLQNAATRLADR
jgi:hypothetical protein